MKITVKQLGEDYNLEAINEEGNTLLMDNIGPEGERSKGMRPMQLLLSALGGCSAIDVIGILKKQKQAFTAFEIIVEGGREKIKEYALFKNICLHFKLAGEIDGQKVKKAVELSLEKYCSVSKTLEPTAHITYRISINGLEYKL